MVKKEGLQSIKKCDVKLIEKAQNGDDEAFSALIKQYSPLISSIVRKYFLAGFEVEDLMQIGYISLIKAIKDYKIDSKANFSTYLYMAVLGDIKNEISKSFNNKNLALNNALSLDFTFEDSDDEDGYSPWAYLIVGDDSIEDEVIKEQKVKILLNALRESLDKKERQILSYYLQGYKYAEIANMESVTTKKVDNTITKAKRILANYKKD